MDALYPFLLSCPYIDDTVIKITLAIVLGSLIGFEREYRGRAAGIRTLMLVCLGSALVMLGTTHISEIIGKETETFIHLDPTRIAAGIVTGIGFLGAGAIIRHEKITIGLTTASLIWFIAGVGISVGLGLYAISIQVTLLALILLIVFNYWQRKMNITMYREISLVATYKKDLYAHICKLLENNGLIISKNRITRHLEQETIEITFSVKSPRKKIRPEIVDILSNLPEVKKVAWE